MFEIRELHTTAELEAMVDLEIAVWGLKPRDAVPSSLAHVLTLRGGLVLGATEADTMIGVLLALPVRDQDEWLLWSHMTGIHPAYQGRGVGAALKRWQRTWALAQGYRQIGWTFDPLQRGNAHFNFHVLGQDAPLVVSDYHENFYGELDDDINRGIPSDRLEVRWLIDQPPLTPVAPERDGQALLTRDPATWLPVLHLDQPPWAAAVQHMTIPSDLEAVRQFAPEGVLAWRLALRSAMQAALARGYQVVDFAKSADDPVYVLRRDA